MEAPLLNTHGGEHMVHCTAKTARRMAAADTGTLKRGVGWGGVVVVVERGITTNSRSTVDRMLLRTLKGVVVM